MPRGVYPRTENHRAAMRGKVGVYERTPEHRTKISEELKGRQVSIETRMKIGAAQQGRILSPEHRARISETTRQAMASPEVRSRLRNAKWQGETIAYRQAHARADSHLFRFCYTADRTCRGRLDTAFRHDAPVEYIRFRKSSRPFYVGPNPEDGYWRLCRSHHQRYDLAQRITHAAV